MLFNEKVLEVALSQIGLNIGWQSMSQSSMRILQTLVSKYIQELGKATMGFANNFNRSEPVLTDTLLAMRHMNISVEEIQEYLRKVEQVPFAKLAQLPKYPCPPVKGYARINFPSPEEVATRPEYFEEWLPSINFGDKSNGQGDKLTDDNVITGGDNQTEMPLDTESQVLANGVDGTTLNGERKDSRPDNWNDHIYLSSVYIDAEGHVVGIAGHTGVAPDSKLPPRDDVEERRLAEEEAKKRKKEDEENEKLKKKQKINEEATATSNAKIKFKLNKLKDKPGLKNRKIGKIDIKKRRGIKNTLSARRENLKKKSPQTLSIKFSGLRSDSPTAKPSTSFSSPSPSADDYLGNNLGEYQSKLSYEQSQNLDDVITSVIERSREGDLDSDIDVKDFDFENDLLNDGVKGAKFKRQKPNKLTKVRKKREMDETIEQVIKGTTDGSERLDKSFNRHNVFNFNEDNESDFRTSEDTATGVDAKEAAKILLSISGEPTPKKSRKLNSRKIPRTPSPLEPPLFSSSDNITISKKFSKSSPNEPSSPGPNSTISGSRVKSPSSNMDSQSLYTSSRNDPFSIRPSNDIPSSSPLSSSSVPPYPPISDQILSKPPIQTLAARKELPPINQDLLHKKEKREKKKRDKLKEKSKDKDKSRDRSKVEKSREKDKIPKNRGSDIKKHTASKDSPKSQKVKPSRNRKQSGSSTKDTPSSKKSIEKTVNPCPPSPSADVPSPSSSTSSSKLVIRTPATPSLAPGKDPKKSSLNKHRRMSGNSGANESVKSKSVSKERNVKDKGRGVKDDRRVKDRGDKGDASCVLITETVIKDKEWYCPVCNIPYDGVNDMIGCDACPDWYHWTCVGITEDPGEQQWFCPRCTKKRTSGGDKVAKKSSSTVSAEPELDDSNPKGKFVTFKIERSPKFQTIYSLAGGILLLIVH